MDEEHYEFRSEQLPSDSGDATPVLVPSRRDLLVNENNYNFIKEYARDIGHSFNNTDNNVYSYDVHDSGLGQTNFANESVDNRDYELRNARNNNADVHHRIFDQLNIKDSGYGDLAHTKYASNCVNSSARLSAETVTDDDQFVDCSSDYHGLSNCTLSTIDASHEGSNEEFTLASEVFEDQEWNLLQRVGGDGSFVKVPGDCRQSVFVRFDPLYQRQVLDNTLLGFENSEDSQSVTEQPKEGSDSHDLIIMSTPSKSQSSGRHERILKHPAARKLSESAHADVSGDLHPVEHLLDQSPVESKSLKKSEMDESTSGVQDIVQVLKYSQLDVNRIKKDLELQWNSRLLAKEKEWGKKLAAQEKELKSYKSQVSEMQKSQEEIKSIMAEYEKVIAGLIAEKDTITSSSQNSMDDIVKERDQALEDLKSVEMAFSDLHKRYEKTKSMVEAAKQNQDTLKQALIDKIENLRLADQRTISVKEEAEKKLTLANIEVDKIRKSTAAEVARLEAALKKTKLEYQSLQQSYEQKVLANQELTSICDDLMKHVDQQATS